ncbi:hypothetical protein CGH76_16535 [Vibrio parahaemolyticus]|nr:hypothetical protein CGH76_16535 [Vibrio parahaemolyticus]
MPKTGNAKTLSAIDVLDCNKQAKVTGMSYHFAYLNKDTPYRGNRAKSDNRLARGHSKAHLNVDKRKNAEKEKPDTRSGFVFK